MKAAKILSDNRSRKLLALVLSIVILPLLVVSAFYASLAVVPTYSPLFHLNFTFPANYNPFNLTTVISTNSNEIVTLYFLNGTRVPAKLAAALSHNSFE